MTMVRGRVVWDGKRVLARPGWGRWAKQQKKEYSNERHV
jgi:hypothetical protein